MFTDRDVNSGCKSKLTIRPGLAGIPNVVFGTPKCPGFGPFGLSLAVIM